MNGPTPASLRAAALARTIAARAARREATGSPTRPRPAGRMAKRRKRQLGAVEAEIAAVEQNRARRGR